MSQWGQARNSFTVKLMVVNTVKRILEIGNGSVNIQQFFKAEQNPT